MQQDPTIISPSDDVLSSSALVLVSRPAGTANERATCVASFSTEYNNLNCAINGVTTELLEQDRKLAKRSVDELLPLVNRMWMHLSQREDLHALVSGHHSLACELEQLADVPTWTRWYEVFSSRIMDAPSLRSIQRKLKKLRGSDEPETAVDDDATESDSNESSDCGGSYEREEVKTGAELLAEHIKQMENVLAGKSIMSDGMRIKRAIGHLKDLQCALEEGFLFVAPPLAESEKVAVSPDKLDPPVSMLNAEPYWQQVLVELLQVLEQSGDRLPLVVLKEKRKIDLLLAGKGPGRPDGADFSPPTKRYIKVMKLDPEGNRNWTVVAEGEKKAWGTFDIESDADIAIADLRSPVVSLMGTDSASKKLPATVTPSSCARVGSHESAA